jgi:hypothetical protein
MINNSQEGWLPLWGKVTMCVSNQKVSIHQPSYFPWLGLLHKINLSDLYIYMDDVQLADRAYQHRNIFLTNQGDTKFLTVNTSKKEYRKLKIHELKLSNSNWNVEHLNFLKENYRTHPFFSEVMKVITPFYKREYETLNDVLFESMILSFELLDIKTEVVKMSEMAYDRTKSKSDLILELILKSTHKGYLSGTGAKDYMNLEEYAKHGVQVEFQEFTHPVYEQKGADEFVVGLAVLDLFFNLGIEESRQLFHSL